MKELMKYSTAKINLIGGRESHKTRLKKEGRYLQAVKDMREQGFNPKQISSIIREVIPIDELELFLMIEFKLDLLEAREAIHSCIQYGLLEYKTKPKWLD